MTRFCVHSFFYSFSASDGSEATTEGRVISPRPNMVQHGFKSKESSRAGKLNIDYPKTTSQFSLLVARQGDAYRNLNQALFLVDSFNLNFYCCITFKYYICMSKQETKLVKFCYLGTKIFCF